MIFVAFFTRKNGTVPKASRLSLGWLCDAFLALSVKYFEVTMAQLSIYANKKEKTSFQDNLSTCFKKTDHNCIVQKT